VVTSGRQSSSDFPTVTTVGRNRTSILVTTEPHHLLIPSCLYLNLFPPPGRYAQQIPCIFQIHNLPFLSQDLGKSSNDLLGKDFYFQGTSLEVKTKTPSNVTFKVQGSQHSKSKDIHGDVEAKYTDSKNGLTVTQTWSTTNVLKSQLELDNQIAKGLKFDLTTSLAPDKNTKSAVLHAIYKQSGLHSRALLDVFKVRSVLSFI
jgi:Eukaryotic porin